MKIKYCLITALLCVTAPLCAKGFPLCLYGVNNPEDLKLIKKAGFSCIQSYQKEPEKLDALAQQAQKLGLQVVFYPNEIFDTRYMEKAQRWPMLAWYLVDEPDVHHWSRERVIKAHQKTKQAWPKHHTTLVIGQGQTEIPYYDIPDIMMMDWYPVPHLPLTSFGDNIRYAKEGLARTNMQHHSLWGVVQIFDWKNFKQHRPDNDRVGRFPTVAEIRFMAYDGILNGGNGLFFYTFEHLQQPMPKSAPQYWKRVTAASRELAKFKKIMEQGIQTDNPAPIREPLQARSWQYKNHLYTVLVNRSAQEQALVPLFENSRYKLIYNQGKKPHRLAPYSVWIFKR